MSFIFDSTKNKKNEKIQVPESDAKNTISVVDILTHRVNHLDDVTNNLDKNIDNIIDHVNTFIDNTENNHKELLNRVMNDEAANDMEQYKMEETMNKLRGRIDELKESNDSLENNLEEFSEQIEQLSRRLKISFCVLTLIFMIAFGALFAHVVL